MAQLRQNSKTWVQVTRRRQILIDHGSYAVLRGVATGDISVYIPQNQSTLNFLCDYSPVTQDRFDMIYVHVWDINICFEIAMTC